MSPPHGPGMASSPHSTDETTNHGTPSTNLTAFTPEADFGSKGRAQDFARPVLTLRPTQPKHATVCDESEEDVFLTAPIAAKGQQLSPTAEVFTPRLSTGFMKKDGETQAGYIDSAQENMAIRKPGKFMYRPINFQKCPPSAQVPPLHPSTHRYGFGLLKLDQSPFKRFTGMHLHDFNVTEGVFSLDEGLTRTFVVMGVAQLFPSQTITRHYTAEMFPTIKFIKSTRASSGLYAVSCADLRDSLKAARQTNLIFPHSFMFVFTGKQQMSDIGGDPSLVSDYEGQIIVSIHYNGRLIEAAPVVAEIKRLLLQCGEIKAFHSIPATRNEVREIRVEFYNADVVDVAKDVIRQTMVNGAVLDAATFQPDVLVVSEYNQEQEEQLSVTGRSRVPFDPELDRIAYAIQHDGLRHGRRLNQAMNHNAVDIARIQAGLDVRTTIMLRNIPNRVDQPMLKTLLDVTSRGRYDFMYLRIDFANNCNVGYAFINFVDFVLARAGKRWNCFASDKIAEVSYATIQGKDCLVQKFRNSSVMLEHPAFRPKLFIAGNGPTAGQEEKFPGPDNHSKMRRSIENAEHVGLYIPLRMNRPDRYPVPPRHRRNVRRTGRFNVDEARRNDVWSPGRRAYHPKFKTSPKGFRNNASPARRNGVYLPPARANKPNVKTAPKAFANNASPARRQGPLLVDTRDPHDPFAGRPRHNSPQGQVYREEQRRRRSQFDRGTPGAENELGVAPRYHLQDPALEHMSNIHLPRF
ncbi:uncharacterized protein Z520_06205 [Fonsecaea multimorphosa CBS 102226]|uniref:Mei2-like C-terminal RNA recognition motif domain-containing protein n=1 Tax=Fonsecaea multimorphosa CBS 102226 TaxID=1442371 RepID=A0A0D2H8E1_9EURO|nr:uncharacterized protein Z520_06205 [Fonsecaea multimorphosa CBS 102226]KIX98125.1 hypothetical protein Z520_06205 [Fonsecaea multimorphosa CBS 102226]